MNQLADRVVVRGECAPPLSTHSWNPCLMTTTKFVSSVAIYFIELGLQGKVRALPCSPLLLLYLYHLFINYLLPFHCKQRDMSGNGWSDM
jgi:hypothetical protein